MLWPHLLSSLMPASLHLLSPVSAALLFLRFLVGLATSQQRVAAFAAPFSGTPHPLPSWPEHPAILLAYAFQEAFPNPSPGLHPPRRFPSQLLCYLHVYLVLCPASAGTILVLFTSVFPAPTTGLRHHSVFKKCFLNNQRLFQTSRIRHLLPRIFTTRNRITHSGCWEPDVSCLPHHRLRTWVWWAEEKEWVGVGEFSTVKIMQRPLVGEEEEEEDVNRSPRAQVLEGERVCGEAEGEVQSWERRSQHWGS